ncbi:MAG: (E)-4-hydroxy-3-methylbut-2-enyl-diphosphate synthase [Bacteroidetes bacterium]|nr:(E)-4-hydroxy-3-methylbut-2-enyl-diphosphate synthase [Bacteroidota bacterium]
MQFYCNSLTEYSRLKTREVKVGELLLGNLHPVRVQTMTTTDTMDTIATVEQSIRCIEAGAELVRITAPSKKDAENLLNIKNELHKRGYTTPLVADIHFTPNAAEIAARIVEKVRVNPGNYVDKKKFEQIEYTDAEYAEEIDRIRERFTPLVKICKEYGTAMRIGTNHGSLSDRIMSRYGDSPNGMVESAMEFLRIARDENYHNIVLSMKASNTLVMVQAYRLLVHTMFAEFGEIYPLHLGVTEAGDGEDGRIKSAVGIGTLLEDGLGDTIRVSLTEDPEFEIPVCKDLVKRYTNRNHHAPIQPLQAKPVDAGVTENISTGIQQNISLPYNPFEYKRRKSHKVNNIGGRSVPVVVADFMLKEKINATDLTAIGYTYDAVTDKWNISDAAADYIYTGNKTLEFHLPGTLKIICDAKTWYQQKNNASTGGGYAENIFPLFHGVEYLEVNEKSAAQNFIAIDVHAIDKDIKGKIFDLIATDVSAVLCLYSTNKHSMADVRRNMIELMDRNIKTPVIICIESHNEQVDDQLIQFSSAVGALLLDGFGDGAWLINDPEKMDNTKISGRNYISIQNNYQFLNATAFSILQAARTRISKTEYISCPSCGRTLFDLQETTAKIREVTNHLKGVKIAIMGCIVNGPGEMADADFGYVGSGVGKITLYKGKEVIKRNVDSHVAVDELINLLKENGAWVDPV